MKFKKYLCLFLVVLMVMTRMPAGIFAQNFTSDEAESVDCLKTDSSHETMAGESTSDEAETADILTPEESPEVEITADSIAECFCEDDLDPIAYVSYADGYERLQDQGLSTDSTDEDMAAAANAVYDALIRHEADSNNQLSIPVSQYKISRADMWTVFNMALEKDLYYYDVFPIENKMGYYNPNTGIATSFLVTFRYSKEETDARVQKLRTAVSNVLSAVEGLTDPWEIILEVHDNLVLNTAYDLSDTVPMDSYYAYGVLVDHIGVCNGYALAMNLILDELDIPCFKVTNNSHAWNMVQIDGEWYQLDATWDDPIPDTAYKTRYTYFLLNDAEMAESHAKWQETGVVSDSTLYSNMPRYDNNNQDYINGKWYVIDDGYLKSYNRYGGDEQTVKENYWLHGIQEMGAYVYYGIKNSIIQWDPIADTIETVYTLTSEEAGTGTRYTEQIYGLCPVSGTVLGYRYFQRDGTAAFGQLTVKTENPDINCDGTVDIRDARLAKRIAMKDSGVVGEYTAAGLKAGDFDRNGKITINEARKIKRIVLCN